MTEMKPYLTIKEAAALTGKDPSRIYTWIRNGDLKMYAGNPGVVRTETLMAVNANRKPGRRSGVARPAQAAHAPHNSDSVASTLAEMAKRLEAISNELRNGK